MPGVAKNTQLQRTTTNYREQLREFVMTSHVFGAVCSPSIAIYALQRVADDHVSRPEVAETVKKNFYVADLLKSCCSVNETIKMLEDVRLCCAAGGFRLTKFSSNSEVVIASVPESERVAAAGEYLLKSNENISERALGLYWDMPSDYLGFRVQPKKLTFTRRGVLATIASVFHPLGFASSVTLPVKKIHQELCKSARVGWDDPLPEAMRGSWQQWLDGLPIMNWQWAGPLTSQTRMRFWRWLYVLMPVSSVQPHLHISGPVPSKDAVNGILSWGRHASHQLKPYPLCPDWNWQLLYLQ